MTKPDRVIVIPSVLAVCALVLLPVMAAIRTPAKVPAVWDNAEPTGAQRRNESRPPVVPMPEVDVRALEAENSALRRKVQSLSMELMLLDTAEEREEWFIPVVLPQEDGTLLPICDEFVFRVRDRDHSVRAYADVTTENGGFVIPPSMRDRKITVYPHLLIQGYHLSYADIEKGGTIVFDRYPFIH